MNTVIDLVASAAEKYAERPAMILRAGLRDRAWSYRQLWQVSNGVAFHLSESCSIHAGDRVLLCAQSEPRYVAVFFGIMLIGAVPVPLDLTSSPRFIEKVTTETEAKALISDLALNLPGVPRYSLADLPYEITEREFTSPVSPGDLAEIIFSSGATGAPKGVMLTHHNIVSDVHSSQTLMPEQDGWRMLSLLPLSHMFEQTIGLFVPLERGATIVYGVSHQSAAIRRALKRYRITVMVVVPKLMEHILQGIEREVRRNNHWLAWTLAHRLASVLPNSLRRILFRPVYRELGGALDIMMCGGAALAPETEMAWERLGIKVIQGYGATECAPVIASNTLLQRLPGSVGKPPPGNRVKISGDGEVLAKGENVFSGYWRNDTATRNAFTEDGWYRTGDLGVLDRDGNLSIKGRKNEMVVLPTGMNVFLEDIEDVLKQQPYIQDCAVVDILQTEGDIKFMAAIIIRKEADDLSDTSSIVATAVKIANQQLAVHQRISDFMIWEEESFPHTALGKLQRYKVRRWMEETFAGRTHPDTATDAERTETEAEISPLQQMLSDLSGLGPEKITPECSLDSDLGLSSLARVELALLLEDSFNVLVEDEDLAGTSNVEQLNALIEKGGSTVPGREIPLWSIRPAISDLRMFLQRTAVFLLHRLVARPFHVEGLEEIVGLETPALFIANHSSHVDTISILHALPAALRRKVAVAAAADYFYRYPPIGMLTSLLLNTFPFSREGAVRSSLEHCGLLADLGWSVLIFPEGTRSATGKLVPFKLGIGLLATQMQVPVVPIAVFGGHDVLPKGQAVPRPSPITVRFGTPLRFDAGGDPSETAASLQQVLAKMMDLPPSA